MMMRHLVLPAMLLAITSAWAMGPNAVPAPPPATAAATAPATQKAASDKPTIEAFVVDKEGRTIGNTVIADGKGTTFLTAEPYDGYFVKNTFEPNAERSLVIAATQVQFDAVFGAGFVMNDRSHRLAANVFDKQLVVAVILRGSAMAKFQVAETSLADGTLTVKYSYDLLQQPAGANYASPLLFSVDKAGIKKVVFIENGKQVGEQALK